MINVFNDKKKKILLTGAFILIVLIAVYVYIDNVLNVNTGKNENILQSENYVLNVGDISIRVDIADTPALREQGLSGKMALNENEGIYFVFDKAGFYPFWMKEMNFPIDIIWVGENMSVVDITENVLPSSFPKTFVSKIPARYVLEVNAGFAERHGVKMGDQVSLIRPGE